LSQVTQDLPRTLGALRSSSFSEAKLSGRSVKDELRQNLIFKIQSGEPLFPGIIGYEDSVVPQVVNAVLSRHNFILLGLRGQAKTRLIRQLIFVLFVQPADLGDRVLAWRTGERELWLYLTLIATSSRLSTHS